MDVQKKMVSHVDGPQILVVVYKTVETGQVNTWDRSQNETWGNKINASSKSQQFFVIQRNKTKETRENVRN